MILPMHIAIAFSGLVFAAITYVYPSYLKLKLTYGLIALTFVSGFYLIWTNQPVHMTKVCIVGLSYLFVTLFALVLARNKLRQNNIN